MDLDLSQFCQSNLLYTQENLSRYKPGGYHPVTIGDTFNNGRYKTAHKIGWGGYSTVWLVFDRDQKRWASLKIMTADSDKSRELSNFKHLESHSLGDLSANYIVQLLDSFFYEGPNGVHQCLVFELLGPSVHHVIKDYSDGPDDLEPEIILRMSRQLLKAVKFIHSSGMCHGDISGGNIAFSCINLQSATEKQLFEVLGTPEVDPLGRLDGTPLGENFPTHLVKAAEWVDWIDEDEEDIRLLDIGESFLQGEEPEKLAQPGSLRVPETIFTDKFDYRVDLWRVGCMIYAFLFNTYPFWYLGDEDVLAFQMIGFVEKLPTAWLSKWEELRTSSKHNMQLEVEEDHEPFKLERKFIAKVHDPSLAPLLPIIQGLMRFLPSDRITLDEALGLLSSAEE